MVIIFEYIHGRVDKNENIELESDDDIRFYPVNNVPFNISDYDDIENLTSSLHDLSIQNAELSASNTKRVDNPTTEHSTES